MLSLLLSLSFAAESVDLQFFATTKTNMVHAGHVGRALRPELAQCTQNNTPIVKRTRALVEALATGKVPDEVPTPRQVNAIRHCSVVQVDSGAPGDEAQSLRLWTLTKAVPEAYVMYTTDNAIAAQKFDDILALGDPAARWKELVDAGYCDADHVSCWSTAEGGTPLPDRGVDVKEHWGFVAEHEGVRAAGSEQTNRSAGVAISLPAVSGTLSGLGVSIDHDAVLNGLTDFLVERTRVELRTWMAENNLLSLCKGNPGALSPGDLLPETCALLAEDPLAVAFTGAGLLLDASREDLETMPRHIFEREAEFAAPKQTDPAKMSDVQKENYARYQEALALGVAARVGELSLAGSDPLSSFEAFARAKDADAFEALTRLPDTASPWEHAPILTSIYTGSILINSFPRADGKPAVPKNADDQLAVRIAAAALVNMRDRRILPTAGDEVLALAERIEAMAGKLIGKDGAILQIQDLLNQIPKAENGQEKLQIVSKLSAAAVALVRESGKLSDSTNDVLQRAQLTMDSIEEILVSVGAGDYGGAARDLIKLIQEHKSPSRNATELPPNVKRALTFAATIAQADSADSAGAAIEAFAAPPGSWRNKRGKGEAWAGVQSYVGLSLGREWQPDHGSAVATSATPMASVGGEGAVGIFNGWSLGLFVSVIDVGALASSRFEGAGTNASEDGDASAESSEESTETVETSKVNLAQVFAPGAHLVVGLGKTPLVLGAGVRALPALREIGGELATDTLQAGAFLAVDIPLFP